VVAGFFVPVESDRSLQANIGFVLRPYVFFRSCMSIGRKGNMDSCRVARRTSVIGGSVKIALVGSMDPPKKTEMAVGSADR